MDLNDMMKQAQSMQQKMQDMQQKMAQQTVQGEAGAGLIKVTMTGRHDVKKVDIDSSLLSENKEVLEDLLAAAVNDAVRKVEQNSSAQMSDLTGAMKLPDGFKFPF